MKLDYLITPTNCSSTGWHDEQWRTTHRRRQEETYTQGEDVMTIEHAITPLQTAAYLEYDTTIDARYTKHQHSTSTRSDNNAD